MSEETKDIEETKVAEEKKMETEQTILSQPTEKKAAETVTQIQQSVEIQEQKEKNEPEPKRSFIRSRKKAAASREEQILSRIKDEDLMKYLEMEHERLEMMQSIKEAREKRSFTMLQLLISLAAIVIVVFLLRDNPTVLVNILYIVGIIIVLWILKGPHEKNPFKEE